jgi:hypothetical protein
VNVAFASLTLPTGEISLKVAVSVVAAKKIVDGRHALDSEVWRSAGWECRALGRSLIEPAKGARPGKACSFAFLGNRIHSAKRVQKVAIKGRAYCASRSRLRR